MRHAFSFLFALLALASFAQPQPPSLNVLLLGEADCEGNGAYMEYNFIGQNTTMFGEATIIVRHAGNIPVDTLMTVNQNLNVSIPIPAINLLPADTALAHKIFAYYEAVIWSFIPNLQLWIPTDTVPQVNRVWVTNVEMLCGVNVTCNGATLSTTGGSAYWLSGGDTVGVGPALTLYEPMWITMVPMALLNFTYDGFPMDSVFYDPLWMTPVVTPTCDDQGIGSVELVLNGTAPYTIDWDGLVTTETLFDGLGADTFFVSVTDGAGCYTADSVIVIDTCLIMALESESVLPPITAHPNPATDWVTLHIPSHDGFEIYNALGQLEMAGSVTGAETRVNIASLKEGVYLVRPTPITGNAVVRLVKR